MTAIVPFPASCVSRHWHHRLCAQGPIRQIPAQGGERVDQSATVAGSGVIPIHFELSAGPALENTTLEDLLGGIDQEMITGTEEIVPWPEAIAGDKGYRAEWIDQMLLDIGVTPMIPSKKNEDPETRSVEFDKQRYRDRNIIERLIGWLKECRSVFARFEKTAINYAGMVKMAFIQRYLKILAP